MIEKINAFADVLIRNRGNTTVACRAKLLGVSVSAVNNWEGLRDITTLPKEEKLQMISEVYKVDIGELRNAWEASKNAMECVLQAKRNRVVKSSNSAALSGSIAKTRDLARTNFNVGFRSRYS